MQKHKDRLFSDEDYCIAPGQLRQTDGTSVQHFLEVLPHLVYHRGCYATKAFTERFAVSNLNDVVRCISASISLGSREKTEWNSRSSRRALAATSGGQFFNLSRPPLSLRTSSNFDCRSAVESPSSGTDSSSSSCRNKSGDA